MAIRSSGTGPRQMKALFEAGTVAGLTDADLLDRFVMGRGEAADAAFSALVDRHGPMVLGVCRRIISDRHAAEDAFQATFLILAKKAGSIRVADTLSRWLYGVSRRVARRERVVSARQPRPAGDSAGRWEAPEGGDSPRELRLILDEEVARLPRRSREVIALCHFEGLSFVEAATRIGCPVGTVGSRLTRARALLRSRLVRRGFGPAAILGVAAEARAEVPRALARAAARLAMAGPSGSIPEAVASLCIHNTRTMIMVKMKVAAAVTVAAGMLVAGATAYQVLDGRPTATNSPRPSEGAGSSPAEEYEALVRECRQVVQEESDAREKGGAAFLESRRARPRFVVDKFTGRFLDLARAHPGDSSSFDALLWVAVFGFTSDASEQAATLLARDHSRDPRLWQACQEMTRGPICPAQGTLLRSILRDNPDRALRGRAGLALVGYLQDQAQFVRLARIPGPGPYQGQFFPAARMNRFRKLDPDAMIREAEEACERVIRDYPDVRPVALVRPSPLDYDARLIYRGSQDAEAAKGTLGDLARSRLDELRGVAVGKPAPEIVGEDDRGKPMSLADFRGKAVLLTFSGNWCGPCVSMYPDERELVKRLAGRPFVLLNVNSDETREQLSKSIESGTITWRCWWEARDDGLRPIAERWKIRAWPTIFLIDERGIIRARSLGTVGRDDRMVTGLGEMIEALIREAESRGEAK